MGSKLASVLLAYCLIALFEVEENIFFAPSIKLLENAVCQKHYAALDANQVPVSEAFCKTAQIQSQLANVRGGFGILADRYGRRPMYALAMFGTLCFLAWTYLVCHFWHIFPIETVWLAGTFVMLGGGPYIIVALNMTIVSDLSTEQTRNQFLYRAFTIKFLADLIGPQIAALALQHSLGLPFLTRGLLILSSFPVLLVLPETLHLNDRSRDSASVKKSPNFYGFSSFLPYLRDWRILVMMAIVFHTQFRYLVDSVRLPYTSVRFGWSISKVATIDSIVPGVSLVIFILLPSLTDFLRTRWDMSMARINLMIVRTSLGFLLVGSSILTAAQTIPLLIFVGFGVRAPLLAVASTYITSSLETGKLYTLMTMTDALSHLVGDPCIQLVWASALRVGGTWLMLPFLVLTTLFLVATGLSWSLPEISIDSASMSKIDAEETDSLLPSQASLEDG
ncbi:hypothetical protein JMJ35_001133 [Cladonia borealis]|uniref:MFS transporter n=1 Tax=Cladonia borealis TaxID=184061 RepID=A0AA39R9Z3_9LECA|nr:hypothetical protein JMJ35_001133 [Cladonia borealis]